MEDSLPEEYLDSYGEDLRFVWLMEVRKLQAVAVRSKVESVDAKTQSLGSFPPLFNFFTSSLLHSQLYRWYNWTGLPLFSRSSSGLQLCNVTLSWSTH